MASAGARRAPEARSSAHPSVDRCRCGQRLSSEAPAPTSPRGSPLLEQYLGDRRFCSSACLRAFLLESLERLDAGVIPWVVSDSDRIAEEIRGLLAGLDVDRLAQRFGAGPTRGAPQPSGRS